MCKSGYRSSLETSEINPYFLCDFVNVGKTGVNMRCVSAGYIDNHFKLPEINPYFLCDFVNIGKTGVNMRCVSRGISIITGNFRNQPLFFV